jgi:hypothetical protein
VRAVNAGGSGGDVALVPATGLGRDARPALLRRWTLRVSAGEAVGFLAPATVGAATVGAGRAAVPLLLAAGAVEGAVLGWAQSTVVRSALPALRPGRWVALTAAGAAVAWLLGLSASAIGGPEPGRIVVAAALGCVLLVSLGLAQWVELRHHVPRAWRWVVITAAAWLLALAVFMAVATPLWHEGQPVGEVIAVGVAAGLLMAVTQAATTGWGMVRLLAEACPDAVHRPRA